MCDLTRKQTEQHDAVDNAIMGFINGLEAEAVRREFPDGMSYELLHGEVAIIRDVLIQIYDVHGIMTEKEFYPYLDNESQEEVL